MKEKIWLTTAGNRGFIPKVFFLIQKYTLKLSFLNKSSKKIILSNCLQNNIFSETPKS